MEHNSGGLKAEFGAWLQAIMLVGVASYITAVLISRVSALLYATEMAL